MADENVVGYIGEDYVELENAATEITLRDIKVLLEQVAVHTRKSGVDQNKSLNSLFKSVENDVKRKNKEYRDEIRATRESIKAKYDNTEANHKGTESLRDLEKEQKKKKDTSAHARKRMLNEMFSAVSEMRNLGDSISAAGSRVAAFVNTVPLIGGVTSEYINAVTEALAASKNSYTELARHGATFGGSITDFRTSVEKTNLTLDQYTNVINKNLSNLIYFDGGIFNTTRNLSDLTSSLEETLLRTDSPLARFGYTMETITDQAMRYQSVNARISRNRISNERTLGDLTQSYLVNLNALSRLSGKSADDMQSEQDRLLSDFQFRGIAARIDGGDILQSYLSALPPSIGTASKDIIATGGAITKEGEAAYITSPELMRELRQLHRELVIGGGEFTQEHQVILDNAMNRDANSARDGIEQGDMGSTVLRYTVPGTEQIGNQLIELADVAARRESLAEVNEQDVITDESTPADGNESITAEHLVELAIKIANASELASTALIKVESSFPIVQSSIKAYASMLTTLRTITNDLLSGFEENGIIGVMTAGFTSIVDNVLKPFYDNLLNLFKNILSPYTSRRDESRANTVDTLASSAFVTTETTNDADQVVTDTVINFDFISNFANENREELETSIYRHLGKDDIPWYDKPIRPTTLGRYTGQKDFLENNTEDILDAFLSQTEERVVDKSTLRLIEVLLQHSNRENADQILQNLQEQQRRTLREWTIGGDGSRSITPSDLVPASTEQNDTTGFATGTPGVFNSLFGDFGEGTATVLHNKEAVLTEQQLLNMANGIFSVGTSASVPIIINANNTNDDFSTSMLRNVKNINMLLLRSYEFWKDEGKTALFDIRQFLENADRQKIERDSFGVVYTYRDIEENRLFATSPNREPTTSPNREPTTSPNREPTTSQVLPQISTAPITISNTNTVKYILEELEEQGVNDTEQLAYIIGYIAEQSDNFDLQSFDYTPEEAFNKYNSIFDNIEHATAVLSEGNDAFADYIFENMHGDSEEKDNWLYRGRSFFPDELVGKENYQKYGDLIGVDLLENPDRANEQAVAARLAVAMVLDKINMAEDHVNPAQAAPTTTARSISTSEQANIDRFDNDTEFQTELNRLSQKHGISREQVYGIIAGESNYNPSIINRHGYAGLFQFGQDALTDINRRHGTDYTPNKIATMSPAEQLSVYDKYLDRWNFNNSSGLGVMQAAPAFAARPGDAEVYRRGTRAWEANPPWRGDDNRITVDSINEYYNRRNPPPLQYDTQVASVAQPLGDVSANVLDSVNRIIEKINNPATGVISSPLHSSTAYDVNEATTLNRSISNDQNATLATTQPITQTQGFFDTNIFNTLLDNILSNNVQTEYYPITDNILTDVTHEPTLVHETNDFNGTIVSSKVESLARSLHDIQTETSKINKQPVVQTERKSEKNEPVIPESTPAAAPAVNTVVYERMISRLDTIASLLSQSVNYEKVQATASKPRLNVFM